MIVETRRAMLEPCKAAAPLPSCRGRCSLSNDPVRLKNNQLGKLEDYAKNGIGIRPFSSAAALVQHRNWRGEALANPPAANVREVGWMGRVGERVG